MEARIEIRHPLPASTTWLDCQPRRPTAARPVQATAWRHEHGNNTNSSPSVHLLLNHSQQEAHRNNTHKRKPRLSSQHGSIRIITPPRLPASTALFTASNSKPAAIADSNANPDNEPHGGIKKISPPPLLSVDHLRRY